MPAPFAVRTLRLAVVGAFAAAAWVTVVPTPAGAAGTPCQRTFSSGPVNSAIADNTTIVSVIDVPEDGLTVTDVNVTVDLHHTFDHDLTLFLYSYTDAVSQRAGSELFDQRGGSGDNLIGTVFDDEATIPVSWGDAPFTGAFMPVDRLSALDGFAGGQYRLQVTDGSTGDTGTLNDWSVTLTYASCDLDSDGVEDHADSCLGLSAHTATGCPATTRTATLSYRNGRFKGALSSPVPSCAAGRAVSIWKARSGADKLVGAATTRADGTYKLVRAKLPGRYYATSSRVAVTDVAECPATTSPRFRLG